jgi:hypothetical protein
MLKDSLGFPVYLPTAADVIKRIHQALYDLQLAKSAASIMI